MFLAMCICMPLIVLLCSLAPSEPLTTPQTLVNSLVSRDIDPSIPTTNEVSHEAQKDMLTDNNSVLGISTTTFLERPPW